MRKRFMPNVRIPTIMAAIILLPRCMCWLNNCLNLLAIRAVDFRMKTGLNIESVRAFSAVPGGTMDTFGDFPSVEAIGFYTSSLAAAGSSCCDPAGVEYFSSRQTGGVSLRSKPPANGRYPCRDRNKLPDAESMTISAETDVAGCGRSNSVKSSLFI